MRLWIFAAVGTLAVASLFLTRREPDAERVEARAAVREVRQTEGVPPASTDPRGDDAPAAVSASSPSPAPVESSAAASEPPYAQPADVENLLLQFIARQPGLDVVSISGVKCTPTSCEIAMTGREVSPRVVDAYSELNERLFREPWSDFRLLSGGLGTREIAPGAREYVMDFEYQPLQALSDDPTIAARQQAACSAAWRRMTENPTPDDVVRRYLAEAERRLALAAGVLGEEEARRIAAQTRGRGPVIRQCWSWLDARP